MYDTAAFEAYIQTHQEQFLQEFGEAIAVPSVAAQKRGLKEMADLLTKRFRKLGATVRQYPIEDGSPVVYAEIGSGSRTLLIYNHYDVQPEDPVELWESQPFTLTPRGGRLYGRGVSDDKGELYSRIQALEAWLAIEAELPLKVKWVMEGEEEIGSVHLEKWVQTHADMLRADGILWEGGGYDEAGRITMAAGCKGIAYFELRVQGPSRDMHSSYAPIVLNPAWRLVHALSTLKDKNDKVTIDGYARHVRALSGEEVERIESVPFEAEAFKHNYGLNGFLNGMDADQARRRLYEIPTVTICGLDSGYQGPGSKTVLPATATAKVDCRLVPDLTPELVADLLRRHLDKRGFTDIEIVMLGGERPARSPIDSSIRTAAFEASLDTWDQTPVMIPWFAGSGPMYPLSTMLDIPVLSAGATWHPESQVHSPNENIFEKDYFLNMHFLANLIERFSRQ